MPAVAPNILFNIDGLTKYFTMIHQRSLDMVVVTFAELGIADLLSDASPLCGLTAEEISAKENWNADLVHRILRACVDAGIVENVNTHTDERHFVLTSSGKLLTTNHPSHARQFLQCQQSWLDYVRGNLTQLVRIGNNSREDKEQSTCFNAYMSFAQADMQEKLKQFMSAMDTLACEAGELLISSPKSVKFSRFESIVDCGGCNGAFLARLMQHWKNIQHGIVFDLPHTIAQTSSQHFEDCGIDTVRYKFLSGNLFDSKTIPTDVNAYLLKYVLDCYEDKSVVDILSAIRQAIERNVKQSVAYILIVEDIIFPVDAIEKGGNWMSHALDVMLAGTAGGKERTVDEYKRLFNLAGVEFVQLYPVRAPSSIIEARVVVSIIS